jgi:hypothetical protein
MTTLSINGDSNRTLLAGLALGARAFADAITKHLQEGAPAAGMSDAGAAPDIASFDPRNESPPYPADPKGSQLERDMAYLTYLGGVMLINLWEGRGATGAEVSTLAKRAGYSNGRAVNGFSINGVSTAAKADGRWVTDGGREWVEKLAKGLGVRLPAVSTD